MNFLAPKAVVRLVKENRVATKVFRTFLNKVAALSIIEGDGSPEGTVDAGVTRLYMDISGTPGSILYIKKLEDIGNDTTKGWILI